MFYPVTTQQSGVAGACETQRSQTLVKSLVRTAFRGEPLFRSLRPDFIETESSFAEEFQAPSQIVPVSKTGLH